MQSNFPPDFVSLVHELIGNEADTFLDAINQSFVTSVRVNPFKPTQQFDLLPRVEWCPQGYYLEQRPEFIFDPLFHSGAYYVQESSSMFLHQAILQLKTKLARPIKVLDLCAAPGGKSTLIASLLNQNDLLVSNEIIKSRVGVLEENLSKWGTANVVITNNDPKAFKPLESFFDIIVVDAPCSGEGLFRRDKTATTEWSLDNVNLCELRQQRIVADIIGCLKPGGYLVYSTCTFNRNENEDNVKWMQQEWGLQSVALELNHEWSVVPAFDDNVIAYRFLPHKVKGEGLFLACLQKTENDESIKPFVYKRKGKMSTAHIQELSRWLQQPEQFEFIAIGERMHAIPHVIVDAFQQLSQYLYLKNAGVFMGSMMKNELVPSHQLALNNALSQSVQKLDVSKDDAIRFLRKDAIQSTTELRGWTVLTYQHQPLGWAKILPNRMNNYLPANLRVVKEYMYES